MCPTQTAEEWEHRCRATADSLTAILARFAAAGTPVTCIILTMVGPAVVDVARTHRIPFAVYWIQPATVLAAEHHYFHLTAGADDDNDSSRSLCLPGLSRPLRLRDFPDFLLLDNTGNDVMVQVDIDMYRDLFESLDKWRPKVLVNTLDALETGVLADLKRRCHLDVVTVGPMVTQTTRMLHMFEHDDEKRKRYMDWLDARPAMSVVYASFGSATKITRKQLNEVATGLRQCGRPYLLVVRRDLFHNDNDNDGGGHGGSPEYYSESLSESDTQQQQGMVVEWCDQQEVLSHGAIGCFVSHCGWNSTVEAMVCGVPIIGVPNSYDQPTNAYLVEEEWKVDVRGERDSSGGVVTGAEVARCVELVMAGDGERAMAIRERMKGLKERARAAVSVGGSVEINLRDFVNTYANNASSILSHEC